MRKTIIMISLCLVTLSIHAQKVTFHSKAFEMGVRQHIGVPETEDVLQTQTDTITRIDLSGLGITDIRDVAWLNHVREIDLSDNEISDASPLALLDSLQIVELRDNELENISNLLFANADSLTIDVTRNYIEDFSLFFRPTRCVFTLMGVDRQSVKGAAYFNVYHLYGNVNDRGGLAIDYRAYSNMDTPFYIKCGTEQTVAQVDGMANQTEVPGNPQKASLAWLTNGIVADSTYVVPPSTLQVGSGETVSISTGLPGNYQIGYSTALRGALRTEGNTLQYTAPDIYAADTIYYSYYEEDKIRGYSMCFLAPEMAGVNEIQTKTDIAMTLKNHWLHVEWQSHELSDETSISVYDGTGRLLASKKVDSRHGINADLFVRHARQSVLFIQVTSGRKKFVEKIVTD